MPKSILHLRFYVSRGKHQETFLYIYTPKINQAQMAFQQFHDSITRIAEAAHHNTSFITMKISRTSSKTYQTPLQPQVHVISTRLDSHKRIFNSLKQLN